MIELQNEQLANCRGFDGETFNYPPVEKVPCCLKLICPFWLLPCPRCLSACLSPVTPHSSFTHQAAATLSISVPSAAGTSARALQLGLDTVLFVKCGPKIWALGGR